ncbi:hypothetical protein [Calothrix sp. PCC 6303]|jgi:hypothetical protein|nr:hypothetical protein [Calothrix sp. PCC 6303]AFZ01778.1 coiled-coil domain containing 42 [Calothrix sp. PCC 6303]
MFTLLEILKKVKPTHEESLNRDLRLQKQRSQTLKSPKAAKQRRFRN